MVKNYRKIKQHSGILFSVVLLFLLFTSSKNVNAQFYYGSQMDFGKNRVQYQEFLWSVYNFDKYDIYFYLNGKPLAIYTAKTIKNNIEQIQDALDYTLEDKVQFVVYNKQSDFKQSNVGLVTNSPYNIGGVTRIVGSKIFLYYEGDNEKFERQIKSGIAEVVMNQMMYGGSWKDILRSSAFLNIPEWYSKGLTSYLSYKWDVDIDNKVRDGILSGRYHKFSRLTGSDAIIAGHSLWNYIAETYGPSVIPNILYMTRVSRNIESGFLFVLGTSLKTLTKEWEQYYQNKYYNSDKFRELPKEKPLVTKIKSRKTYSQLKISPNGKYATFVTNELGQYKIYLYDLERKKKKRIYKREPKLDRLIDLSYPLISWHPTSEFFTFFTEEKGKIWMTSYNLENSKMTRRELFNFEKIIDFSYSSDGKKYVFSAVQGGQTDIFVYNVLSNSVEQITKDVFDDQTPQFINKNTEIIFSSNRDNDTIRFSPDKINNVPSTRDLFLYDYKTKSNVLRRLTETPEITESHPRQYDAEHISFLSDHNGIRNRFVASFDSTVSFVDTAVHYRYIMKYFPVTNYARNIVDHDINGGKIGELMYVDGKTKMFIYNQQDYASLMPAVLEKTSFRSGPKSFGPNKSITAPPKKNNFDQPKTPSDTSSREKNKNVIDVFAEPENKENGNVDIDNYRFDDEKKKEEKREKQDNNNNNVSPITQTISADTGLTEPGIDVKEEEFRLPKQLNYNKFFMTDYFVSQLDNSFLSASYQRFQPGVPFYNPGFNGLFKVGISDLFENDRFSGGFRLSGNFNSNEFFTSYEMLEKRWDKQIVFHRQAIDNSGSGYIYKVITNDLKYSLKFPFSEVASIKGSLMARNDRFVYKATELSRLKQKDNYQTWGIAKLEYVYDNTLPLGINLYKGTRLKLFAEYYNQFQKNDVNMAVLGLDVRNYIKIHRELIWANRIAASSSFGKNKLIYYLGGVDNWLWPKYDNEVRINRPNDYAFQTIATNMRGFIQNSRNGSSFAVLNSELRWPMFRYLFNKPLRSEFINNFQLITFGDLGTAWVGKNPFSDENTLFTRTIAPQGSPLEITLYERINPLIGGYGWGMGSKLLGYFVRVDWAWGVQNGEIQPRVFYLSLSLDF